LNFCPLIPGIFLKYSDSRHFLAGSIIAPSVKKVTSLPTEGAVLLIISLICSSVKVLGVSFILNFNIAF